MAAEPVILSTIAVFVPLARNRPVQPGQDQEEHDRGQGSLPCLSSGRGSLFQSVPAASREPGAGHRGTGLPERISDFLL